MTGRKIDEAGAHAPPGRDRDDDLTWPQTGGSWIRDPETGALEPAPGPENQPAKGGEEVSDGPEKI